jgi:hypothetical protein
MCAPGLDPTWEETFEFDVADENTTKCFVKFMMGAEGEEKQIGDQCEWRHLADSAAVSLGPCRGCLCVLLGGGQEGQGADMTCSVIGRSLAGCVFQRRSRAS